MSKKGYIKLYRQISDTPVWTDSDKLKLWLMCLMKATHEGKTQVVGNQIIELKPGQFITGRTALYDEFNRGVKKDRRVDGLTLFRWLNLFEKMEMLYIKKTNKYSLVTVLNWDKYQGQRTTSEHQVNIKRTSNEQQLNTNKNDKNIKNDKKEDICYQQIADMYNNTCVSFPRLTKLSDDRKKAIKARLRTYTVDDLQRVFSMAEQSDFLKGANDRNWSANFDWMMKDSNMAKILDGNYTNKKSQVKNLPEWFENQDIIKTESQQVDDDEIRSMMEKLKGANY